MRALRIAAVILAITGLALLYAAARHSEPPLVKVEELSPAMNFAQVRMTGTVTRNAYVSRDGRYVSFPMNDGSGQILVAASGRIAEAMVAQEVLPASGSWVDLQGGLRISATSETKLYLRSADHLVIESLPEGGGER
jgi:HAMP domain-containing protein